MKKKMLKEVVKRNVSLLEIESDLRKLSSFSLKQIKLCCEDELENREKLIRIQNSRNLPLH